MEVKQGELFEKDEITMDCPQEHTTKLVLVSIWWSSGEIMWRLAPAIKVGRHYQIDESSLYDMQRDYWKNRTKSRTEMDVFLSLTQRPYATYREWGASKHISNTGIVPLR